MSSLALLAARATGDGEVAAAVTGGHGELFIQQFNAVTVEPTSELLNLAPQAAAAAVSARLVVGSGAKALVDARGWGEAREAWPSAANALALAEAQRSLSSRPIYARAPDARVPEAA
jgi:tRNA A37 threonylcarbamoyladenosine modification protein TsaB